MINLKLITDRAPAHLTISIEIEIDFGVSRIRRRCTSLLDDAVRHEVPLARLFFPAPTARPLSHRRFESKKIHHATEEKRCHFAHQCLFFLCCRSSSSEWIL